MRSGICLRIPALGCIATLMHCAACQGTLSIPRDDVWFAVQEVLQRNDRLVVIGTMNRLPHHYGFAVAVDQAVALPQRDKLHSTATGFFTRKGHYWFLELAGSDAPTSSIQIRLRIGTPYELKEIEGEFLVHEDPDVWPARAVPDLLSPLSPSGP